MPHLCWPWGQELLGFLHCPCWKAWQILEPSRITLATFLPLTDLPNANWDGCWAAVAATVVGLLASALGAPGTACGTQWASRATLVALMTSPKDLDDSTELCNPIRSVLKVASFQPCKPL